MTAADGTVHDDLTDFDAVMLGVDAPDDAVAPRPEPEIPAEAPSGGGEPRSAVGGALLFAGVGFYVLPTRRDIRTRKVLVASWNDASSDQATIKEWARRWPSCNFACHLERSELICLDLDNKNGKDGEKSLQGLKDAGVSLDTLVVRSQSGGYHLYHRRPAGELHNIEKLPGHPGVEAKANATMTLPGSFYQEGGTYELLSNGQLAEAPKLVDAMSDNDNGRKAPSPAPGAEIPAGGRNQTLTALAGSLRRQGVGEGTIGAALLEENKRCAPPLPVRGAEYANGPEG